MTVHATPGDKHGQFRAVVTCMTGDGIATASAYGPTPDDAADALVAFATATDRAMSERWQRALRAETELAEVEQAEVDERETT